VPMPNVSAVGLGDAVVDAIGVVVVPAHLCRFRRSRMNCSACVLVMMSYVGDDDENGGSAYGGKPPPFCC
jgi:hypothetical protein